MVNSALLDLVPGQVNTVNVECGAELATVTFKAELRAAAVDMDLGVCASTSRLPQPSKQTTLLEIVAGSLSDFGARREGKPDRLQGRTLFSTGFRHR